jgi:hypothetical protein
MDGYRKRVADCGWNSRSKVSETISVRKIDGSFGGKNPRANLLGARAHPEYDWLPLQCATRSLTMAEYPPYVNAYNGIQTLFSKIKSASVPPKFTVDFLSTALDLKTSSYRAMIPLLKKLGFLDPSNVPTQAYKDYREDSLSGSVMARQLKEAYKSLFQANEYAWKLDKEQLVAKLKSLTGAGEDDPYIPSVAGTFLALSKLAKWEGGVPKKKEAVENETDKGGGGNGRKREEEFADGRLRLSYTINLNLPATTEIEVFNAIFKSLRENLLRES